MLKMYYTDQIAAAYMAREFGVKFEESISFLTAQGWQDQLRDLHPEKLMDDDFAPSLGRYYIHPDSLPIFEPMVGDLVTAKNDFVQYVAFVEKEGLAKCNYHQPMVILKQDGQCPFKVTSIIQREGKPFFWPEVEQ